MGEPMLNPPRSPKGGRPMTLHPCKFSFQSVAWTILTSLTRRQALCPLWLAFAGIATGLPREASAHDFFTAYIQHQVQLTVGARHLDLTVDLTFFEEWSAHERRLMDANGDGRITHAELDSYLKKLAPELARQVRVRVTGRDLALASLYEPEVDLLGNDKVGPGHHRLRLHFFAPTPPGLRATDAIVIEDRLWPEAKALATLQAEGHDGCALEPEMPSDLGLAPARPGEAQRFTFRCLKPPTAPSAAGEAARPAT